MDTSGLLSKSEYISNMYRFRNLEERGIDVKWSSPLYKCQKCGGPVRKNFTSRKVLTPPLIISYEYTCDNCGFTERIFER